MNLLLKFFRSGRSRNQKKGSFRSHGLASPGLLILALFPLNALAFVTNTEPVQIPSLREPLGEISPSFWEQYGILIIAIVLFVTILLGFALWLLLKPKPIQPLSAATKARESLASLMGKSNGAWLSEISRVLKHYFAEEYAFPPIEFTTSEFCALVERDPCIGLELGSKISVFLKTLDENKFAPGHSPANDPVSVALKLVQESENRQAMLKSSPPSILASKSGPG
jgi:hypothetical protein